MWYIDKKVETSCLQKHIPGIMRIMSHESGDRDSRFQHLRSEALLALARAWILGREKVSVFDLVRYVNENDIMPEQSTLLRRPVSTGFPKHPFWVCGKCPFLFSRTKRGSSGGP